MWLGTGRCWWVGGACCCCISCFFFTQIFHSIGIFDIIAGVLMIIFRSMPINKRVKKPADAPTFVTSSLPKKEGHECVFIYFFILRLLIVTTCSKHVPGIRSLNAGIAVGGDTQWNDYRHIWWVISDGSSSSGGGGGDKEKAVPIVNGTNKISPAKSFINCVKSNWQTLNNQTKHQRQLDERAARISTKFVWFFWGFGVIPKTNIRFSKKKSAKNLEQWLKGRGTKSTILEFFPWINRNSGFL